jgi:hypothetical protein
MLSPLFLLNLLLRRDNMAEAEESTEASKQTKLQPSTQFIKPAGLADTCEFLLDPSRRPKWYTAVGGADSTKSADVVSSDLEIRPFIDKSPPNMHALRTANGLDKVFVDQCWNSIKGMYCTKSICAVVVNSIVQVLAAR